MLGFRPITTPAMRLDRLLSEVFHINRLRHDAIDWYIAPRASEVNAFCLADQGVVLTAGFVRAYTEGRLAHRHALAILNHEAGHHHHHATRYNYTLAWLTLPCRILTAMARGLVRSLSRSIPAARLGLILVPVIATVAVVQMVQAGQWGGLAALAFLGFVAWLQPVVDAAVCRNSEWAADRYVASLGCAGDLAEALALYAGRGECRGWQQTHPPTAARIARLRSMSCQPGCVHVPGRRAPCCLWQSPWLLLPSGEALAMNHHLEMQDRAAQSGSGTPRGEAALDELAAVTAARWSHTPAGIARVLDEVMHTNLADLTGALSAIAVASEQNLPRETTPAWVSAYKTGMASPTLRGQGSPREDATPEPPNAKLFASVANPPNRFMMAGSTRF